MTPYAQVGGDDLTMDQRRFETVERQLYWLFDIFGNGIIDDDPDNPSWLIENVTGDTRDRQVSITPGRGHVAWKSCRTTEAVVLDIPAPPNLGTNQSFTYFIYAEADKTTPHRQTVKFFVSNTELSDTSRFVGLGCVLATQTSNGIVLTPNNTSECGRVEISLFSTIADIVNRHKHIGGSRNPSPIDLRRHVQGKLSGDFIEDGDLSTFTKGTLDPDRLPQIDHNTLTRRGTLTHAEIDSLLGALEIDYSDRLADLFGVNILQFGLAAKKRSGWDDIDEKTVNTILYVPGVTPDSYVAYYENYADYGLTDVPGLYVPDTVPLAIIDKSNREIRGVSTSPINSDAIAWVTDTDFNTALELGLARTVSADPVTRDIEVTGEGIAGGITLERPLNYSRVATEDLTDWQTAYRFTDSVTKLPVTPPPTQLSDDYDVRRHFFNEFDSAVDWSDRTKIMVGFNLGVDNVQGDIYMYLLVESGGTQETVTTTAGASKTLSLSKLVKIHDGDDDNGDDLFAVKNLLEFVDETDQLVEVIGIGFIWDTVYGWDVKEMTFELNVPDEVDIPDSRVVEYRASLPDITGTIFVWNGLYYADTGRLVFRFDSNYELTQYDTAVWTVDIASYMTVYTRVANTEEDLGAANRYQVVSGVINPAGNVGRWIDVIVELRSSTDNLTAPFVDELSLQFRSPGASATKVWDRKIPAADENIAAWSKAEAFVNVICDPDTDTPPNDLKIQDVTHVGEWRFIRGNNIYTDFDSGGDPESTYADGESLPLSPRQVWNGSVVKGFSSPVDATYLDDSVVVADTANDRLAHVSLDNVVELVVQGNIRLHKTQRAWAALAAYYNPTKGRLWVAFSQNVTVSARENMALVSDLDSISLADADVNVVLFGPDTLGKSPTLEVRFSTAQVAQINAWTGVVKLVINEGALVNAGVSTGDEQDPGSSDGGSSGGGSGSGGGNDGGGGQGLSDCGLPDWLDGQEGVLYGALGGAEYTLASMCPLSAEDGLSTPPEESADDGVFDPNETRLQGPGGQVGNVILDVYVGNVVFDNLYSPQSSQYTDIGDYVVATGGNRAVIAYSPTGERDWSIKSSVVKVPEGRGGSAYLLDSGNVLVAAPADGSDEQGRVTIISRAAGNVPLVNLTITGDPVRALPDPDGIHYWTVIYDRVGGGKTSRLMRLTAQGNATFIWGVGTLVKPTGLALLPNGHILVSE
ncbi:MAG: hypothetical protein JSS66_04855 [Armatimonadetes bacterium]|nr:hypothetical protein [Armatimonadota bacterium]